jgi:hypothetical protein
MLEKIIIYVLTITLIASCSGNQVTADTHMVAKTVDTTTVNKRPHYKVQEFEDEYDFYNRLLSSLKQQDNTFNSIIKLYDGYVVDTNLNFKNKNTIRVILMYGCCVDLYVKNLNKLNLINYNTITFDSASVFKYYHATDTID